MPTPPSPILLGISECPAIDEGFEKDGRCGRAHAAGPALAFEPPPVRAAEALDDPGETDILHVLLDLEINPTTQNLTGTNTLTVRSLSANLTTCTLDLRSNMTVTAVSLNGNAAPFTRPRHQVVITLDRAYGLNEEFTLAVGYTGTPQNLGWGSFTFSTQSGQPIISTLSQPWYAHTWWPCKEVYANIDDKFTLDMRVTVPDTLVVASNGLLQSAAMIGGGRKQYRWLEQIPVNTYLVSLAITNYATWTASYNYAGGSMPVEFYAYPSNQANMQSATASVPQMIATFSQADAYGQYPFVAEKYGIAQFPWGGGMEHQTITSQGAFSEWLNAHELAHQWWGDNITCKTWHDIWLNEGFASFSEALWYEKKPGGSFASYKSRMNSRRPSSSSWGDTVYVYDISSQSRIFSTNLTYNKGAWVVHMLRRVLGDAIFFAALANYRAIYDGGYATTDEFRVICEATAGRDLQWFFNEWIYGGGVPYYRYGWQNAALAGRHWVRLHVEQYQTSYPNFAMPIDVVVTTPGGSTTHTLWHEADTEWYVLPADAPASAVAFDPDVWILRGDGASTAYVAGPPKLVAADPAPAAVITTLGPTTITLDFSEPITFGPADLSLVGTRTGPQSFTTSYSAADARLTLNLAGPLPAADLWTLSVADTIVSTAAGLALDGELSTPPSLPGGDGLPGGNCVLQFQTVLPIDFDADGDVDDADLRTGFLPCLTGDLLGPVGPACTPADLDQDSDVDLDDFAVMQACLRGSEILPDPTCLP